MDSSHGRAIATPTPRSIVRLFNLEAWTLMNRFPGSVKNSSSRSLSHSNPSFACIFPAAFVEEVRARDDRFDQDAEPMTGTLEAGAHFAQGDIIRQDQRATEGVSEQLAAEVIDELVLTLSSQVLA